MTVLDLMTTPEELAKAKQYFDTDQQKYDTYKPLVTASDVPAIHVNDDYMRTYRPLLEPYYYDSKKYNSYLEQLGIDYPNPPDQGHSPSGGRGWRSGSQSGHRWLIFPAGRGQPRPAFLHSGDFPCSALSCVTGQPCFVLCFIRAISLPPRRRR